MIKIPAWNLPWDNESKWKPETRVRIPVNAKPTGIKRASDTARFARALWSYFLSSAIFRMMRQMDKTDLLDAYFHFYERVCPSLPPGCVGIVTRKGSDEKADLRSLIFSSLLFQGHNRIDWSMCIHYSWCMIWPAPFCPTEPNVRDFSPCKTFEFYLVERSLSCTSRTHWARLNHFCEMCYTH